MRTTNRFTFLCGALAAASLLLVSAQAHAFDEDSAAVQANKGLRFGVGPELLVPVDGGPLGGGLILDGRYGIDLNPVILAPGARLAGYYISERFIGTAMPMLRLTTPLGPLAPFVLGGVGGGGLTNDSEGGVALLVGAGLMIHVGSHFAFGAEGDYQTITSTEFQELSVGPALQLSF